MHSSRVTENSFGGGLLNGICARVRVRVNVGPSDAGLCTVIFPYAHCIPGKVPEKTRSPLTQKPLPLAGSYAQGDPCENFLEELGIQPKLRNMWKKILHPVKNKWGNWRPRSKLRQEWRRVCPQSPAVQLWPLPPTWPWQANSRRKRGVWLSVLVAWCCQEPWRK